MLVAILLASKQVLMASVFFIVVITALRPAGCRASLTKVSTRSQLRKTYLSAFSGAEVFTEHGKRTKNLHAGREDRTLTLLF